METKSNKIITIILAVVAVIIAAVMVVMFVNQKGSKKNNIPIQSEAQSSQTQTEIAVVTKAKTKEEEIQELKSLYSFENNASALTWNVNDPGSWKGVSFNASGKVEEIDISNLDLQGELDLSGFSELKSFNAYGNKLSKINLSGCVNLESLDVSLNLITLLDVKECKKLKSLECSFNDFSKNGLDVSNNTGLINLKCDDCKLKAIDIGALTLLEDFSCSFNELTSLNIDNNKALTSIVICYNYLDTHVGSELYKKLDDLMFSDVYVNYYPQSVPENAVYNKAELNVIKEFALLNENEKELDWLDDKNEVDTFKLQNNVLFEFDGSEYRIVAMDFADTKVKGDLKLNSFTMLKELYCENTGITLLDLNDCTSLEVLSCDNCEIRTLVLPSNASEINTPLYEVCCDYNYIDTSIFTDEIVRNITLKAGAKLEYKDQKNNG